MCVQFLITSNLKALAREYGAVWDGEIEWKPHVFPRYIAPVVVGGEKRLIQPMSFGLIPFFAKEEKPKMVFHNARVETVAEKPSFKRPFVEARCIVPVESFFEYVPGPNGKKQLINFAPEEGGMMSAAGIWSIWRAPSGTSLTTFSILTTEPPEFIARHGHDRCPLFLSADAIDGWLDPKVRDPQLLQTRLVSGAAQINWRAAEGRSSSTAKS